MVGTNQALPAQNLPYGLTAIDGPSPQQFATDGTNRVAGSSLLGNSQKELSNIPVPQNNNSMPGLIRLLTFRFVHVEISVCREFPVLSTCLDSPKCR
jgi:hypothetical protein